MKRENLIPSAKFFSPRAVTVIALAGLLFSVLGRAETGVQVTTFKTHSRLVLRVDDNVGVEWSPKDKSFELVLKGTSLTDLGAPVGSEERWLAGFASIQDPRIESLSFKELSDGVKISGKWRFPTGKESLAAPKMESFHYRERAVSRFVVDFWVKKGPTAAEVDLERKKAERLGVLKNAEEKAKERAAKRAEIEKKRTELEDLGKFCRQPLDESKDVFLQMIPVHEKVVFNRWFPATTPDVNFPYYEPKTKDKDAQYVRLALDLYKQGKPGLVIRTLDFFDTEHPDSAFKTEMQFLRANTLIKLGHQDEADQILQELMTEQTTSPVALHSGMFLAGKLIQSGSYLASLESFLWLINHYPDHRLSWLFHLGAGESLYYLKQTDRALKEYEWVLENSPEAKGKSEAALRLGDLYMERFQYDQALASYYHGLARFKEQANEFPAIHLNRAEALYGLGQYDRASESFVEFLKKYPSYPQGWRAMYRLGEIHGRKKVAAATTAESRKWFSETINRFPFSPGATLSRIRLVPCEDHGGFNVDSASRFFKTEAAQFEGAGEIAMKRYRDYRGLAYVRTLIAFGKEDRAVSAAIQELQSSGNSEVRPVLSGLLAALFQKHILNLLAQGKKYEALSFYREKVTFVPKEEAGLGPEYLLKLSQAASDLELGKFATDLTQSYEKAKESQIKQATRTLASVEEKVLGLPPQKLSDSASDLEIRLKASEQSFTQAKALWMSNGAAEESKIRQHLDSVVEESLHSYEKEIILGIIEEKAGKFSAALKHASRAQILMPQSSDGKSSRDRRVDFWLAKLYAQVGDPKAAVEMYRSLESYASAKDQEKETGGARSEAAVIGLPPVPMADSLMLMEGELFEKMGNWGEAATAYSRIVEAGRGGNHAKYEYARALLKSGESQDRGKALATLEKIADAKNGDFWGKMAREALATEKRKDSSNGDAKEGTK